MARITPSEAIARITAQSMTGAGTLPRRSRALPMECVRAIGHGHDSLYLIRQGQMGFIAPATDTVPPLLGLSDKGDFTLQLPPCMEEWLDVYAQEVEDIISGGGQNSVSKSVSKSVKFGNLVREVKSASRLLDPTLTQKARADKALSKEAQPINTIQPTQSPIQPTHPTEPIKPIQPTKPTQSPTTQPQKSPQLVSITPLLNTTWSQSAPFNQNLTFDGETCYVGCVPVAIGQLLYYWALKGYKRGCKATKAYTTRTRHYKVAALPPVTEFDFAHMVPGTPKTKAAKKAVADMLEMIGKALYADYTPDDGTGVRHGDSDPRLSSTFKISKEVTRIRASKTGIAVFCAQILTELISGRPVMLTGSSTASGAHAFLCDGYRSADDMYHFNWGYGGKYDGYYKMSALKLSDTRDYSYSKSGVIHFEPEYIIGDANRDGRIDISDVLTAVDHHRCSTFDDASDINSDGYVDGHDVQLIADIILGK